MRIPLGVQFRQVSCLFIAWLVTACQPSMAWADLITATITGTVLSGTDGIGVFLAPGSDLTGQNFTLTFTFDDTLGVESVTNCGNGQVVSIGGVPCASSITGNPDFGTSSPGTAVLTISGQSYSFETQPGVSSSS